MDEAQFEIDGVHRKILFHGECETMRPVCRALCCREWDVGISAEEHASGRYDAEVICVLTEKACPTPALPCIDRRYRLGRRDDRSCVYLEDDRCRIYDERPRVCRDFSCQSGWRLASVFAAEAPPPEGSPPEGALPGGTPPAKAETVARLTEDMTFVPHPLLKLHTVFYLQPRREVVFVKEMVGACGKFTTRGSLDLPQLDDAALMRLIDLFARKEPLGQVYRRFCERSGGAGAAGSTAGSAAGAGDGGAALTLPQFFEIVWLLNQHSIVLDSRNFKGMLGGVGAIG